MADDMNDSLDTENPPHPSEMVPVKVGRLDTLSRVRREAARLYRDLRNRRIGAKNCAAGCKVLGVITQVLEVESLERRLGELELLAGKGDVSRSLRPVVRPKLLS